jgi:hypothetical protein
MNAGVCGVSRCLVHQVVARHLRNHTRHNQRLQRSKAGQQDTTGFCGCFSRSVYCCLVHPDISTNVQYDLARHKRNMHSTQRAKTALHKSAAAAAVRARPPTFGASRFAAHVLLAASSPPAQSVSCSTAQRNSGGQRDSSAAMKLA